MQKIKISSVLIAAIKAEGTTQTGRLNIVIIFLAALICLWLIPAGFVESLFNTYLVANNKEPIEALPSWFLMLMIAGTFALFFVCMRVVYVMDQEKQSIKSRRK